MLVSMSLKKMTPKSSKQKCKTKRRAMSHRQIGRLEHRSIPIERLIQISNFSSKSRSIKLKYPWWTRSNPLRLLWMSLNR